MIALLLAAAMLQAPDPCNAAGQPETPRPGCPQWRLINRNGEAQNYVDPATLRRDGAAVELTTRQLLPPSSDMPVASIVSRFRFDCTRRTSFVLHVAGYTADGVTVAAGVPRNEQPRPTQPGSASAMLMDEYCAH